MGVVAELNPPRQLVGLHPLEYEHSLDSQALEALKATPGLEMLGRQIVKHGIERMFSIQLEGSNIRISERNYPELHQLLIQACTALELPTLPRLYLEEGEHINGYTVGVERPIIVLSTGAVERLSAMEMLGLLGHEAGHIKSAHGMYHLMAQVVSSSAQILGDFTFGLGNLLSQPLQFALLRWSRCSEFSSDRAGLLACQDPTACVDLMLKLAGSPHSEHEPVHREEFIEQAMEFESINMDSLSKVMKFFIGLGRTHPWTVLRCAELLRWVQSGEYDRVLNRQNSRKVFTRREAEIFFCRACSYRLQGDEAFCPHCGGKLES